MGSREVKQYRHTCDFCKKKTIVNEDKYPKGELFNVYSHYFGGYGDMEALTDISVICNSCWEKEKDKPERKGFHKWMKGK
jgi:hypothetical protein